ncbi:MBL fold metallo-hydrolase [Archangium lipolyticum]|uniref:MBL fold metallo-hydrolase n=1 Tax=Archangium lipolyticum TaxID=2970465 RepID=UPI00214A1FDD|nr:MBL fold metallo-hydrolase [Archangium lipolyticum]
MIFRQLFDQETWTYTYLIGDESTHEAALIDPVLEQVERDLKVVTELGLKLTRVLETHVHADHVTGAGRLRELTGARVAASPSGAPCVDQQVKDGDVVRLGGLSIQVLATPGHTDDSLSFLVGNKLFTGDALLIRACGRTDFQNGNAGQLYDSITGKLFTLPEETEVYPGHDYAGLTMSTVGEEKRHNPRFVGRSREAFIEFMNNRKLAPPKKLEVAVPANRSCGKPVPQAQA